MNKSLKVFLACALGAFIGTLVAFQVNGVFWWFGLLIGGLVGYMAYEFKMVLRVIPRAWRAAVERKPNKEWWRQYFLTLLAVFSLITTITIGTILFVGGLLISVSSKEKLGENWLIMSAGVCAFFSVILSLLIALVVTESLEEKDKFIKFFLKANPVRVYLWLLPKYILKGLFIFLKWFFLVICHAPKFLWKVAITIGRFIKTLFILIHSEIRLLCAIDAAIGTAIGYFAGSAIIGGIFGGLFGVLNYEILSKRVLRLVPQKKT